MTSVSLVHRIFALIATVFENRDQRRRKYNVRDGFIKWQLLKSIRIVVHIFLEFSLNLQFSLTLWFNLVAQLFWNSKDQFVYFDKLQ